MTITFVKGDVLDALDKGDVDFVLHCCNNKGVMGSGIAKSIKERYPEAFKSYYQKIMHLKEPLGSASCANGIINLIAQNGYGSGKRFVHYGYLAECLSSVWDTIAYHKQDEIEEELFEGKVKLGIPYKMASDRAGGDWDIVLELIEGMLSPYFDVYVYELEE